MMALFALFITMFALVPVVEAAECGVEPPSAHESLLGDLSADYDQGQQPMHAACSHGHCHHSSSTVTPTLTASSQAIALRIVHALPLDDLRVPYTPDGLKRPPRS